MASSAEADQLPINAMAGGVGSTMKAPPFTAAGINLVVRSSNAMIPMLNEVHQYS
jgi:hypothetical protein